MVSIVRMWRQMRLSVVALVALGIGQPGPASAQASTTYPERPVRMVVSYAPGNVTDTLARLIAENLTEKWKQPVAVENRPGLGGSLGAQSVVKAPADGYTLLFSAMAAMAINPHVYSNIGYDPQKDFAPIVNVAYPESVMVVSPSLGVRTVPELVAYSKANPDALNYGTAGNGTVPHLNTEALKTISGLQAQHVPYKAASAVLTDLLGGRIQLQQESLSVLLPHIESGKLLVVLATGARKRLEKLPDVPTLTEIYPEYEPVIPWLGIFAPAGTPEPIVRRINQDVVEILQRPDIRAKLQAQSLNPVGNTPEEFAQSIAVNYEQLGELVQNLGLKVD